MRELVIDTVIKNYLSGLDEITPIRYLGMPDPLYKEFNALSIKREELAGEFYRKKLHTKISFTELLHREIGREKLYELLNNLPDESILECLRGQHCQQYR